MHSNKITMAIIYSLQKQEAPGCVQRRSCYYLSFAFGPSALRFAFAAFWALLFCFCLFVWLHSCSRPVSCQLRCCCCVFIFYQVEVSTQKGGSGLAPRYPPRQARIMDQAKLELERVKMMTKSPLAHSILHPIMFT